MSYVEFVQWYFEGELTAIVLLGLAAAGAVLTAVFVSKRNDARARSHILVGIFGLLIFTWGFFPASLVFCGLYTPLYEIAGEMAVRLVLGLSLLTSVLVALPLAVLVAVRVPRLLVRRLARKLSIPGPELEAVFNVLSTALSMRQVRLWFLHDEAPVAFSFGGGDGTVVVSEGLGGLLDSDEMETVIAHELAHVRSQDSRVSILVSVYRRILFFDPALRLLESKLHGEREFAADEFAAYFTGKPLSLASALLKISSHAPSRMGVLATLSVVGLGSRREASRLRERVKRLMQIADRLKQRPRGDAESDGSLRLSGIGTPR